VLLPVFLVGGVAYARIHGVKWDFARRQSKSDGEDEGEKTPQTKRQPRKRGDGTEQQPKPPEEDPEEQRQIKEIEGHLGTVRRRLAEARELSDRNADKLLIQNPRRRDEAAVAEAVKELDEGRAKLNEAAEILRKSGPYKAEIAENARKVRLEHLEAEIGLFEVRKQCLEAGDKWTRHDEKRLEEQLTRAQRAEERYKELLR
jgi:hypothetical protein